MNLTRNEERTDADANRDPISGTPGAHPVGTGVGAVLGGAAAGAATGTVAGPLGTVLGAAVGAVLGGYAGKRVAESIDPTVEDAYWRDNHSRRPYFDSGATYDDYGPAYGYGVAEFARYPDRSFDEVEPELGRNWEDRRGDSALDWDRAKPAARDAWQRLSDTVERAMPGDADRDGK